MKPRSIEFHLDPADNQRLANLCGALDQNLRQIEEAFDVRILRRGDQFTLEGAAARTKACMAALAHFYGLAA